jgi:hypothetical protein
VLPTVSAFLGTRRRRYVYGEGPPVDQNAALVVTPASTEDCIIFNITLVAPPIGVLQVQGLLSDRVADPSKAISFVASSTISRFSGFFFFLPE